MTIPLQFLCVVQLPAGSWHGLARCNMVFVNRNQTVRMGKDWSTRADLMSGIPRVVCWDQYCLQVLLTTSRNVLKAVAKSLLMIAKYIAWRATVLRYRKTSTDYKNGLTCGIYTLMLQSVWLCIYWDGEQRS